MLRTFDLLISAFQDYTYFRGISQQGNCGVNLEVFVFILSLSILNCKLFPDAIIFFSSFGGNYFLFVILFRRISYFAEGFDVVLIDKS